MKSQGLALFLCSMCTVGMAFRCAPVGYRAVGHPIILNLPTIAHTSSLPLRSSSNDNDAIENVSDVSDDDLEEVLLRINFSYPSPSSKENDGSVALAAVQKYTQSFPFAAVLPVQPLTYIPVQMRGGATDSLVVPHVQTKGLKVTFLRKKTAEKGSMDGGLLFSSSLVSEEECDEVGLSDYKKIIQLKAWRITKGQTVSKIFSEKQIVMAFIKGLSESRGDKLLQEGGNVEVVSIFHPWM